MSNHARFDPTHVVDLDAGFCDPALTRPTMMATFWLRDHTRVEVTLCDAVAVHTEHGPRLESHQILVAPPSGRRCASVTIVQLRDLAELNGMPEVLQALEHFERGELKDAARYAAAAGPRWSGLVDYFGGPT